MAALVPVAPNPLVTLAEIPLKLSLQLPGAGVPNTVPILLKYQQTEYAQIILDWTNSANFFRDFAIPQFITGTRRLATNGHARPTNLPAEISWPAVPGDFTIGGLTPLMLTALRAYPYRVMEFIAIKRVRNHQDGFSLRPIETNRADRIPEVLYCGKQPNGEPYGVPDYVLDAMIESSMATNNRLPEKTRIIICDLYLSRPNTATTHGWHCDSGNNFGVPEAVAHATAHAHGHDNLEYLSLLMLTEPGHATKSTTIVSQLPGQVGEQRQMATMLSTMGTCLCIKDTAFFHSTPVVQVQRANSLHQEVPGRIPPIEHRATPLAQSLSHAEITDLETPRLRSFIRIHFVETTRYGHDENPYPPNIRLRWVTIEGLRTIPGRERVVELRGDELNARLTEILGPSARAPLGLGIGGSKNKNKNKSKNKTRKIMGGNNNLLVYCSVKDYYYFDKFNTHLEIIF